MFKKILILMVAMLAYVNCNANDYSYFKGKQITIIVPYGPGGNSDIIGRILANSITTRTGIKTLVLNKPGALGSVGAKFASQQNPDGLTVLFANDGPPILNNLIGVLGSPNINDLDIITPIMEVPQVIVVSPEKYPDIKTYKDLVKKIDSKTNYSSATNMMQVWVNTIVEQEKIDRPQQIAYKSQSEVLTAVLKGEVLFTVSGISDAVRLIESGKLHGLASATQKRIPIVPNIMTLQELGISNAYFSSYFAIWSPVGMKPDVKENLNMLFQDALWDAHTISVFHSKGLIPIGGDLSAADKFRKSLIKNHTNVVKKHRKVFDSN
jgi:tripartite-type tricarboxylate transporter receptor subunit TctC